MTCCASPTRCAARSGSPAMDDYLSGLQNLTMIGRLGLSDAAGWRVKTYPGGMRPRLDLAASLIAAPPVLFLDEPTAGLDPPSRHTTGEGVRGLVRAGATVLLT